jgi:ABC-type phosphate/phosphonate transport system substrate-binding protein
VAFRFGLIPHGRRDAGDAFARSAAAAISASVEVHHAADYRGLVAALENGLVQAAWIPPISAARAIRSGSIVPIVVTLRNGATSYNACLFCMRTHALALGATAGLPSSEHIAAAPPIEADLRTGYPSSARFKIGSRSDRAAPRVSERHIAVSRADRAMADALKMRDLRAAWVDRESASGFIVIRAALRAAGVSMISAFKEEVFLRSHAAVARAVGDGRVDIGATFFSYETGSRDIARAGWREGGLSDDQVHIVAQAGPIPSDIFAVHSSVPRSQIAALQAALIDARPRAMHVAAKELVHADGFVRPTEDHIAALKELLSAMENAAPSMRPPAF